LNKDHRTWVVMNEGRNWNAENFLLYFYLYIHAAGHSTAHELRRIQGKDIHFLSDNVVQQSCIVRQMNNSPLYCVSGISIQNDICFLIEFYERNVCLIDFRFDRKSIGHDKNRISVGKALSSFHLS